MADPLFDLVIYHHGSLSGPRMAYVGGDIMTIERVDANRWCFWDLTNILEIYLGYRYNDIPTMYYMYDEDVNEDKHGLTNNNDFMTMLRGLIHGRSKKLHVFVDHVVEEPVEPVPIEVVQPMLLLSQSPSEVEINHEDENVSQTHSNKQFRQGNSQSNRQ